MKRFFFILSIIITCLILLLSFHFKYSFFRIYNSFLEIKNSFLFFLNTFFFTNFNCDINILLKRDNLFLTWLPLDYESFKNLLSDYFHVLFNFISLKFFLKELLLFLLDFTKILMIICPVVIFLKTIFKEFYYKPVVDCPNKDSFFLRVYKKTFERFFSFIIGIVVSYFNYLKRNKVFIYIWVILFMFYFNFFSIFIFLLAFYFYFVSTFKLSELYIFIYKIIYDLMPMILFIPGIVWIIICIILFDIIRSRIALKVLIHFENRNKGFINSLGQMSMIAGPPGTSKTLTQTDMLLSQEIMFRDKALDKIMYYQKMFPDFPFINLEKEVERAFKYGEIFNLASVDIWCDKKIKRSFDYVYDSNNNVIISEVICNPKKFFDYDFLNQKNQYFNGYMNIDLFDMIINYSKCYFVYIINTSLIVSNYAIRSDNYFDSVGNFPLWHSGFFNVDPNYVDNISIYSHILDFDAFRLLKQVHPENNSSFDIGVFGKTEFAKERGNQIDHRGLKKDSDEPNQLNDGYSDSLKTGRHAGSIDNTPFLKIISDDQRTDSLGADTRQLCEKLIYIKEKSDYHNPVFLFNFEYYVYSIIKTKYDKIYKQYRYYRCDNTLLFYLLKHIFDIYHRYIDKKYNRYGYYVSTLLTESGMQDNEFESNKYYLMFSKIYLRRYSTDCYSDFFVKRNLKSKKGINDLPSYSSHKATIDELQMQNSYFIDKLTKNNL